MKGMKKSPAHKWSNFWLTISFVGNQHHWREFVAFRKISGFVLFSVKGGLLNQLFENPVIKMQQVSYVREMGRNTNFLTRAGNASDPFLSLKINRALTSQKVEEHLIAPNH